MWFIQFKGGSLTSRERDMPLSWGLLERGFGNQDVDDITVLQPICL
jgi:hypothetical protein